MTPDEASHDMFKRRFTIAADPPPPWSWERYETWLEDRWLTFLATTDPLDEEPFQRFLEQHPCLLPGGDAMGQSFGGHHGGWSNMVIAQPFIPGISKRYPDFMWLTKNSEKIIPVLIEIEAPGKRWFNLDGSRSAKLTHAQDQVAEWRQALDNMGTRQQLSDLYDFPQSWALTHNLTPRFVLIFGRATEFAKKPTLNKKRGIIRGETMEAMTFDRLRPLPGTQNSISVRVPSTGAAKVIAVPPTFRIGPRNAETIAFLDGWSEAIQANTFISEDRKTFLLGRLPYWTDIGQLSRQGNSLGITTSSDWE